MPCSSCFRGHDHTGPVNGVATKLHGFDVYISNPSNTSIEEVKGLIVILPDAFGWATTNIRRLADTYADRTSCRVYVPDFMEGTAAPAWTKLVMHRIFDERGIWGWIVKPWLVAQALYSFLPFMLRNGPPKRYPSILRFLSQLRESQPPNLRIGVAGFCWGGYGVVRLAQGNDVAANGQPLIDVAYTAHPSEVEPADFQDIKVPFSMVIGDSDFAMDIKQVGRVATILENNKMAPSEVVVIPNAPHGFAVRGPPDDPVNKEMADKAEDQLVRWFTSYLR